MEMKKNPILVFTGLAIVAVAAVAGLTRGQWSAPTPRTIASPEIAKAPETVAPAAVTQTAPAVAGKKAETAATVPAKATAQPEAAVTTPSQQSAAAQPQQPTPPAQAAVTAPAAETAAPKAEVPAFDTVRVEKSGETVIAGTAEAGSEVVVKLDGAAIGKTTANSEGAFVIVPDAPLAPGSGALTIEAKAKGASAATASEQSVAVIVPAEKELEPLVAVISPNAPTKVLQKPVLKAEPVPAATVVAAAPAVAEPAAKQPAAKIAAAAAPKPVSIDAVDYGAAGNIVFSGQGEPGHTARVYVDDSHTGDAAIGSAGRWTFAGTAKVATGVHSLRVDSLDSRGKVLNRVEVPFFREEQSKVAAAVPADLSADQTAAKSEPMVETNTAAATPPEPAEQPALSPDKFKNGRVVIQPGNNLWRISRVLYGSGTKYTLLFQANKDQIRNPNRIYPGQIFMTPDVAANRETIDPKRRDPLLPEEGVVSAQ